MRSAGVGRKESATAKSVPLNVRGKAKRANGKDHGQLQELLRAMRVMADGDFSVRMTGAYGGEMEQIAEVFNAIVAANKQMEQQLSRVGELVGREGRTRPKSSSPCRAARGAKWNIPSTRSSTT